MTYTPTLMQRFKRLIRWRDFKNVLTRIFIHRNYFLSEKELRARRKKRWKSRRDYDHTVPLMATFGRQIIMRDGPYCAGNCGRNMKKGPNKKIRTIDHIIPVSKGGKTVLENLQIMCRFCNQAKGNRYDPKIDKPRRHRDHSRNRRGMLPASLTAKTTLMPMPKQKGAPTIYKIVPLPEHELPSEIYEGKQPSRAQKHRYQL